MTEATAEDLIEAKLLLQNCVRYSHVDGCYVEPLAAIRAVAKALAARGRPPRNFCGECGVVRTGHNNQGHVFKES